jgi:hypothetical protein
VVSMGVGSMATPPGCPLGGKEGVLPGAYVARPYRCTSWRVDATEAGGGGEGGV